MFCVNVNLLQHSKCVGLNWFLCYFVSGGKDNASSGVLKVKGTQKETFTAQQLNIQRHVEFGFTRRTKEYIYDVFSQHREPSVSSGDSFILKKNFPIALKDLKIKLTDRDMEELFKKVDIDRSESLSFDKFYSILSQPSDLERWALSIPFHYLVADAVSCIEKGSAQVMETASNLTESDIQVICNGILDGMKRMIADNVSNLKKAFDYMRDSQAGHGAGSKFSVSTMSSGDTGDFHNGLEGRIGFYNLL
jgi:hypothetical protein